MTIEKATEETSRAIGGTQKPTTKIARDVPDGPKNPEYQGSKKRTVADLEARKCEAAPAGFLPEWTENDTGDKGDQVGCHGKPEVREELGQDLCANNDPGDERD